ncbi:hypothetical protein [Desulfovulcanus sp.]
MYDKELVLEILSQLLKAIDTVIYRFAPVKTVDDFTDSLSGMEKLDAICMQLITIGESLKQLDMCWFSVNWNFRPSELEKEGLKTEVKLCQRDARSTVRRRR